MPHLVILYTPNLDAKTDMTALCRVLADTMLEQRDEAGKPVFPAGGTRVLAYPAAHCAVADGKRDYAFVYLELRMAAGRSDKVKQRAGEALLAATQAHFAPVLAANHVGVTLQLSEVVPAFDGRFGNLHPLFSASTT